MISNIVFTKNRPLQLDAYLTSLKRFFPTGISKIYILYKVELFEKEYEKLFDKYPNCIVVREKDFHSDFMNILNQIDTEYLLFGIDDVVFFDSVDFSVIDQLFHEQTDNIFSFTMRFSPESLADSNDVIEEIAVADQKVYRLNWQKGRTSHTRYPFELCSTIYRTDLVRWVINGTMSGGSFVKTLFSPKSPLIRTISKITSTRSILKSFGFFFSPNTLESWNCRWCQNHSTRLPPYTYFQRLCASAIQVNMVNTSTINTFDGSEDYTVEALNDRYKKGYSLDVDFIVGNKPRTLAGGREYFRLTR